MSQLWLVCYDIADPKQRRQAHDLLKNYGERVQWSVFECYLDERALQLLRAELVALLEGLEGSVRWYPLCAWCCHEIQWQGNGTITDEPEFYLV